MVEIKKEKKPKVVKPVETEETKKIEIVKVIESKEIATQDAFGKLTRGQVDLLKTTIAKGASDDELNLFIQVCKGAQLNPFLRQVFLVMRWDSKLGKETGVIQVGIDGFRSIAESSGNYAGNSDPIFSSENQIEIEKTDYKTKAKTSTKMTVPGQATVTVYKMVDGVKCEFVATARWNEYYPGPKIGFQWHIRPFFMLGKCAEALALRKAFPKLLSGMYVPEEMDNSGTQRDDNEKQKKGFDFVLSAIEKCKPEQLSSYKEKMMNSEKYTDEQKKQFAEIVDKKIEELNKK